MKRWVYVGGALLVLVVLGVYFFFSSLDSIVKAAIEKIGSSATQAEVRVKAVNIELTSGKGTLSGLTVGNPSGFKTERALSLGEISLQVDVGSVTKDTVVIKEIVVTAPEVTYEIGGQGSNIDALKRNVDAYAGAAKGKAQKAEGGGEGKKLIVENLYIRNGKVNVSASALGGKTLGAPLPDIHLTNIGKQSGGATAGEVARQVLGAIGQGATKAVTALPDVGKLLGAAKESAAGAAGSVGEAAKEAGEGLKKLFGK
jgi:uncharacterized protein involved in outer membrane biogenesis